MPIPKKNQLIGIDIGSHAIKLVEIDYSKQGKMLKNFGIIGLPPDAIVEGAIKEQEIVSSAIGTLLKNLKVKNKNVATSISGYSVIVKKIALANKEESEIEATIQEEAEQYIPFDINEVNLDFDIMKGSEDSKDETDQKGGSSQDQMEVILVAAKKDVIDDYLNLLNSAGLNPAVLDVDAFALQNAFEISIDNPSGCFALVNVGAEELGINAIKGGISLFTRDSSYGGSQINEAIMSAFDVKYEEAEKIKLGGTALEEGQDNLKEIFTSVVSEWVQEIKRALDFVSSTYPDEIIEKIMLSGGSCRIPGFQKYLGLETGIPVEEINPFTSLNIDEKRIDPKYLKAMAPQAAVAVGLALRNIGDK